MSKQSSANHKIGAIALSAGIIIAGIGGVYLSTDSSSPQDPYLKKKTFAFLTAMREAKKKEVLDYFETIKKQANSIKTGPKMQRYFISFLNKKGSAQLEYEIDRHYVKNYSNFYDILFIDATGHIFHTIRKESDYKKHLFKSDDISSLKLAQHLKTSEHDGFVEYENYFPSDEPAAFFSVKFRDGGKAQGWFVLQIQTNHINAILTDRENLGRTGEVYLVNSDSLMLSESRFIGDSTILRQKVDTQAIKEDLLQKSGEKILNNYRGVRVFSSFERFDILGASWVIIVEIDEDEIITEHFKKHESYFIDKAIAYLSSRQKESMPSPLALSELKKKRIDMNEYGKSAGESYLTTGGVATCTAISISYPGKFAYLAHIPPHGEIYIDNMITKYFLKKKHRSFLGELIEKIKHYEIYPYELNKLHFDIVAPHSESFTKAVNIILSHGIELAHIEFYYNPDAQSANIMMSPPEYDAHIIWNAANPTYESAAHMEDLGSIVKKLIHYDETPQ